MCALRKLTLGVILCGVFLGMWIQVSPLYAQETKAPPQYPSVPAKPGERCTVCGVPLTKNDVALIVRGRRVPLNNAMVDSFLRNPEKYFSTKQPKGALFQEELNRPAGVAQGGISSGWFLFGLYVLVALIFGGMGGYTAVSKGLRPIPHFFIGFFFSAIGYLYVLSRPAAVKKGEIPAGLVKVPTTHAPIPCSQCGNTNHPSATKCAGCGAKLQPLMQSEVTRTL